jgi:DNA-binding transcriptional regulator LsrR (DeoR family)
MTRSDIADYLGLTIETVSRTLTRLRVEGLIEIVSRSRLVISDRLGWRGRRTACLAPTPERAPKPAGV